MPRKKEPISILEGKKRTHLTRQQKDDRKQNENRMKPPADDKIRPPAWLSKEAKKEFKRMLGNLQKLQEKAKCDLISNLDVPRLALWANAYAEYQKIDAIINIQSVAAGSEGERMTAVAKAEKMKPLFSRKKALFSRSKRSAGSLGFRRPRGCRWCCLRARRKRRQANGPNSAPAVV